MDNLPEKSRPTWKAGRQRLFDLHDTFSDGADIPFFLIYKHLHSPLSTLSLSLSLSLSLLHPLNYSMNHLSYAVKHGAAALFLILLISSEVLAQPAIPSGDPYPYRQKFSPMMAVIIVVLVAALFLMGFFSVYIRHCSEPQSGSVRVGGVATGRSRRGAARGLEASVIDTFPTLEYKVVKGLKIGKGALECAVCLNEFEDDETLRLIPKCDHVFHPECIDEWLASHTTCPVCRANLVPQDGDPVVELGELTPQDDVEAQHEDCDSAAPDHHNSDGQREEVEPEVLNVNQTLNRNRARGGSRSSRFRRLFPRSHSTGHSLVQPGEDTERFTLRLPVEVRKQIINRELHRSTSVLVLPRDGSSRRGPRMGDSGSNNRVRSFKRLEPLDRNFKSDRWVFSRAPSFLTRMLSMKSPKVAANDGEGPSDQPSEPAFTKSGSVRPPV
ncbi:E3 ubiquitin-protein ligase ATL31-like [Argentina anserina]|uniref:E3 ubiquitin-protein ligase ATL31-like n=1 Tax=Argentina anserina TaxID=57926 RepID=UPI0021767CD3|nr:E3 ubiquitin-protein ligase ATL31-like [Potentilla anserina]